jgi:hypothetical protein
VLRARIYETLLQRGLPPTCAELGAQFGETAQSIRATLNGAKMGKTIHMRPDGSEILMAGPFAAGPTAFRVIGHSAAWWANCIWDAFGVAVIAGEPTHVATHCPDCNDPIDFRADPSTPPAGDTVAHFLVPAKRWYDDLEFT